MVFSSREALALGFAWAARSQDTRGDSLALLQTRAAAVRADSEGGGVYWKPTATMIQALDAAVIEAQPKLSQPEDAVELLMHPGEDCYAPCGKRAGGYCGWCGLGHACCRQGWEANSSSECAGVAFQGRKHECVTPVQQGYRQQAKRSCGVCTDGDYLAIGSGEAGSEPATRVSALEKCAPLCDRHQGCGAFTFNMSLGACVFQKATGCQASIKPDSWCFTSTSVDLAMLQQPPPTNLFQSNEQLNMDIQQQQASVTSLQFALSAASGALLHDLRSISELQADLADKTKALDTKLLMRDSSAGSGATLDEAGYQSVARFRSDNAMSGYIRRVLDQLHCTLMDEGGLNGFVPHYSGTIAVKSYGELEGELRAICDLPDAWLRHL